MSIERIQRGYRVFAPLYDLVFGPGLEPGRRAALAALDCRPAERILEVCVGTGLSLKLYPAGVRVTGIDISQDMLDKAQARVAAGRLRQVEALVQMDAQQMTFPEASFDKAALMFALSGLPDPVRAVNEIRRVCKPGGTIVIAQHFRTRNAWLRLCEALLAPIYRLLRYRGDMDLERFLAAAQLDVLERRHVNLFGYATLLVCRNQPPRAAIAPQHPFTPQELFAGSARVRREGAR